MPSSISIFPRLRPRFAQVAGIGLAMLLTACGGSGGSSPTATIPPPTPGMYIGQDATGANLLAAYQADGRIWILSNGSLPNPSPSSLFVGRPQAGNGVIPAIDLAAYALPGNPLPTGRFATFSGTYSATRLVATSVLGASTSTFTLDYSPGSSAVLSLNPVVGTYASRMNIFIDSAPPTFIQPSLALTIKADGTITGTLTRPATGTDPAVSAPVTGTFSPRNDISAYSVTLQFAVSDPSLQPLLGGLSFTGIALYLPSTQDLLFAAVPPSGPAVAFSTVTAP